MSVLDFAVVQTEGGQVKGVKKVTCLNEEYLSFQGIPFAKAPVGKLRFKDPQPAEKWTNILDATKETPACYNLDLIQNKIVGDEDSLHINVFTKNLKPKVPYAVMVYIYGGAFKTGSSTMNLYSPDFLFMHDVIFVNFNYRLGAFGFLSLDDPSLNVPGNAGLKDQNLALEWVKNNIHHFGGDPDNITLFGESAGACSVHYHMISEKSKGLFHKAIPMSGCALNSWSVVPKRNWAERLATILGWNGEGGQARVLEFLQEVDPVKIVQAQDRMITPQESSEYIIFPFGPIIEPYITESTFIAEEPLLASKKAWSSDMDILIGATSEEGLFYYKFVRLAPGLLKILGNLEKVVPAEFDLDIKGAECKELGLKLKKYYYGDKDTSTEDPFYTVMTDKLFLHGIYRTILSRQSFNNHGKTYFYRFNMDSPTQNHYKLRTCGPGVRGVCHADDLSYVFKNIAKMPEQNTDEFKVIKVMASLFASFAISGDPNNSEIKHVVWEPVLDTKRIKCLNISNETTFIDSPETERMALWDSLYEETKNPLI